MNRGNELPVRRHNHEDLLMGEGVETCAEIIDSPDNLPLKVRGKHQRNRAMLLIPVRTVRIHIYPEIVRA